MAYTEPKLRQRIVREVLCGDKGGAPGQWTARKAQLARQRYEAAGGGYKGPKTEAQKKLTKWTGERWTTALVRASILSRLHQGKRLNSVGPVSPIEGDETMPPDVSS